jgi:aryl-alcohol dehydrogenase-like predicted oxidoreductase
MQYATLGNTGLLVSKLCLGTMTFGDGGGLFKAISSVGQAEADALVKTSIDGGINFFDTADNYTEGESETILGRSLKNLHIARKNVVIATKVYSRVGPGPNDIGASRGHIMDAVEASLRRLQTDHIDLYQIHGNDRVTPIEETLRALDTLVQQGKAATSAAPIGRRGRSPKPSASPNSGIWCDSTRCRLITRSPAAI